MFNTLVSLRTARKKIIVAFREWGKLTASSCAVESVIPAVVSSSPR